MKKIDFHVHISAKADAEVNIRYFREMIERNKLDGICVLSSPRTSSGYQPDCNEKALKVAKALPNSYVFAGLHHERDFVEQAKEYMAGEFRGIKLMEGKPSIYRYYGYGFDNPRFEPFFAYAEKEGIPLVVHNNDPENFWDKSRMSASSIAKGWYVEPSLPTHEQFFKILEDVLERHPALNMAIAHLGFYSEDLDRGAALLEKYPNLMFDMTPALVIYDTMSKTPEKSREFLCKYYKRLTYGTDAVGLLIDNARQANDDKVRLMDMFYEGTETATNGRWTVCGMHLEKHMLEDIYYNNAMRFIGEKK